MAIKGKSKSTAAAQVAAAVRKAHGGESAVMLGDNTVRSTVERVYPTGVEVLDGAVCGIGGLPGGRLVELFGGEGSGKSSIALSLCGCTQRAGGVVLYGDQEQTLDVRRAADLGCAPDDFVMLQSNTLNEWFAELETALVSLPQGVPCVVVWDTVAATLTEQEEEAGLGGDQGRMLVFAQQMSSRLKSMVKVLSRTGALLLALNQTREKPGVTFGDNTTTPGGNALKFYASMRLRTMGGAKVKSKGDEGGVIGKDVTVECVKNKLFPPFRKARVRLLFSAPGFDNPWSTLGFAKDEKLVPDGLRGKEAHATALRAMVEGAGLFTMRKPDALAAAAAAPQPDPDAEGVE